MSVGRPVRTRVKICGITRVEDALTAARLGADAVGVILVPGATRAVSEETAEDIVRALPPFVSSVAVFMDAPAEEVVREASKLDVDFVQLHGSEPPEMCRRIGRRVIKRIAVEDADTPESLEAKMKIYDAAGYLLDPGAGSGRAFDWSLAAGLETPFILAGGLTPENVRRAVRIARPYGVDVSSGVEAGPGRKDPEKVRRFIQGATR